MSWRSNTKASTLSGEVTGSEARTLTSLKYRLLSGGAWALGGKIGAAFSMLVANALLARLLSLQEMGAYFLAFSLVAFGAQAGSLGLNLAVVRFVSESMGLGQPGRTRRVVTLILKVGVLGALGVGLAYLLFGGLLAKELFHSPALAAVTGLVAGWMTMMTLQLLLSETFRGFHDVNLATIFGGLATWVMLAACLGIWWLLEGQATLATIMLLAIGSGIANAVLAGWILSRRMASLPQKSVGSQVKLGELLRVTAPLWVAYLTLFATTQADLLVLGAFRPPEEVAVYGAAARLVLIVALPMLVVNAIVSPLIAEMYAQGRKRELERVTRATVTLALMPAVAALAGFVLMGGTILGAVYGDYYRQGAPVLALLSVGCLVNAWAGPCGTTLVMTGHQTTMMVVTVLSGAFAFGGMLWLVQDYGAIGAAGVAAASMGLQNTLALLLVRKQTGLWTHASLSSMLLVRRGKV